MTATADYAKNLLEDRKRRDGVIIKKDVKRAGEILAELKTIKAANAGLERDQETRIKDIQERFAAVQ